MTQPVSPALILIADGRFPAGGYAHSGGLEAAVRRGEVWDPVSLESFLRGRASTVGLVAGAFSAAACLAVQGQDGRTVAVLDDELDARTPSSTLRRISRALGRQWLRAATSICPGSELVELPRAPHQANAIGAVAGFLGLSARDAAMAAIYDSVSGPAGAASKLLAVDPFDVHAALVRLMPQLTEIARSVVDLEGVDPTTLPALATPLLDIAAAHHERWDTRLFAS